MLSKDLAERFWQRVNKIRGQGPRGTCWEFKLGRDKDGYGLFKFLGETMRAHRAGFQIQKELIPKGMQVLHRCDNPTCVRGSHLYLGNTTDNQRDAVKRKRHKESRKTHCIHGHPFSKENTKIYKRLNRLNPRRDCHICKINTARKSRARIDD